MSYKDQVEPTPPEVPRRRRKEVTTPIFVLDFLNKYFLRLFQAKPLPELKKPETEEKKTEV